ncbi:alpha-(1,3)-fucosyltransferase C-like [Zerene cesonia]|uniref:alpha-(1,3)-fucosyltransferase C-like n=1 Tax=Zerene cesonia TaxID=33412 RepID=UPI0018E51D0F|nr:alpha-(1,3)-fucosyltransferase C-like [Zerene cesonia]
MQKVITVAVFLKYLTKKSYCAVTILLLFIIYYGININNIRSEYRLNIIDEEEIITTTEATQKEPDEFIDIRYILLWSDPKHSPFNYLGEGRATFSERNCSWTNCYVTSDRNYLGDYTEFEVVAFNGPDLQDLRSRNNLPKRRSPRQKYVYANIESAATYPICSKSWDSYFNWTWTYRLDSDLVWKYFVIRNSSGRVIGPSESIKWVREDDMGDISESLKEKLKSKTKAAAWFVSNCDTQSLREDVVKQIQDYMRAFNLAVDIFGECGKLSCPKSAMIECLKILEKDYYFYFAFENSLSDDYVTEKVLHALNHDTVPVVYGGANYRKLVNFIFI